MKYERRFWISISIRQRKPHSSLKMYSITFFAHLYESAASSQFEAEVNDRLAKYLPDMDDPDVVLDLRKLNGKLSSSHFDAFWLELHNYLLAQLFRRDVMEREAMYMPVAISVNHLWEIISSKLKEKSPQEDVPIY